MAVRRVLECDICKATPAEKYRFGTSRHLFTEDLCDKHGFHIRRMIERVTKMRETRVRASMEETSLDEINRLRRD